LLSRY